MENQQARLVADELECALKEAQNAVDDALGTTSTVWEDTDFPADSSSLYRDPSAPPVKGDTAHVDLHTWGRLSDPATLYGHKRPLKRDCGLTGMLSMRNMEQGEVSAPIL